MQPGRELRDRRRFAGRRRLHCALKVADTVLSLNHVDTSRKSRAVVSTSGPLAIPFPSEALCNYGPSELPDAGLAAASLSAGSAAPRSARSTASGSASTFSAVWRFASEAASILAIL